MAAERTLKIDAAAGMQKSDRELLAGSGDDVSVTAVLTDMPGEAIADTDVYVALMDKSQNGKCIAYLSSKTDDEGKASVTFEKVEVGSYEITAIVKKQADKFKATVSNSIQLTVNEAYSINYELNGGINHNLNPLKYSAGSKYILLRAASREGYEFTGWYLDPELEHKIEKKWLDISEMTGPITLYAGWKLLDEEDAKPVVPEDPSKPEEPEDPVVNPDEPVTDSDMQDDGTVNNSDKDKNPQSTQTGDDFKLVVYGLLVLAAVAIAAITFRRKTE